MIADAAAAARARLALRYSATSWTGAYRRVVRDSFRTVPFYRERWALAPGARVVTKEEALRRGADLIPLGGGPEQTDDRRSARVIGRLAVVLGVAAPATCRPFSLAEAARGLRDPDQPLAPGTLVRDPFFGYLGVVGHCGFWHVPWPEVYARRTESGIAVTLLAQKSPRLVDVALPVGAATTLSLCLRHSCPVITA